MGRAIRASALVLILACSASAGIMGHDAPQPPPPPPSTQSIQEPIADGQETVTEVQPETLLLVRVALNFLTLL